MDTTDISLLERLKLPVDQKAWARFVDLYTPLIYSWARRAGLQESDAADLVQEVFAQLLQKMPGFNYDRQKSFRAWLRTITLNKWRDRCRRLAARPSELTGNDQGNDAMATLVAVTSETPTPVQELNPDLPAPLAALIMQLLAKNPEERPASAKALVETIQAIERQLPALQINARPAAAPSALVPTPTEWHDPTAATGMLVRRPPVKRRSRGRPLLIVGALAGLVAAVLVVAAITFVQTDNGTLKIETSDDDVQVIVEQNGKRVTVLDKQHGTKATLHEGEYHLRLGEERKDVKLDKDSIQITRDGVTVATITKVNGIVAVRPKETPPTRSSAKESKPEVPVATRPKETKPVDPPRPKDPPEEPAAEAVNYVTNSIGMQF
jgi:RNA polymerase sigma-70 factor (ECF subfamily)